MKTLQEKLAYEIWATDPDDFIAEAIAGTPYKNDRDTLNDIAFIAIKHYQAEIDILKKSLAYNAHLSVRFMGALVHITQMQRKANLSTTYANYFEAIDVAGEALITPDFNSFEATKP